MPSILARLSIVCCAGCIAATVIATESVGLEQSVVRVVNYSQRGDWSLPWDMSGVQEVYGSGFVIDGSQILTNAHVVSDSRFLLVQFHNDPELYEAEIVHIAHDADLALIRPVEAERLDAVPPIPFGDLPELGSTVDTLGYPSGGPQISNTRGVVSRIEEELYVHSGKDVHVAVQTDAAINPGSSGGPVVQDGRAVGLAFQTDMDLENAGFFSSERERSSSATTRRSAGRGSASPACATRTITGSSNRALSRATLVERLRCSDVSNGLNIAVERIENLATA